MYKPQLLEYLEDMTEVIGNGEDVGVIYVYFCKVFGTECSSLR